jgi:metal-responsive CopG/Arc/MetJ family transcriptional regulator
VRVIIQLDPDTLAALDATRGGKDRSAWIRDAIEDRLRDELRDAGK